MKESLPKLEISLCRCDDDGFGQAEMRWTDPGNAADRPIVSGDFRLDIDELIAAELEPDVYGDLLTENLFQAPSFRQEYAVAANKVLGRGERLRVVLEIRPEAAVLESLRWELLRAPEGDHPLSTSESILFSRFLRSADEKEIRLRPRTEPRIAIGVSAPTDLGKYGLSEVPMEDEIGRFKAALGGLIPARLGAGEPLTERAFGDLCRDAEIVYLVCHGALKKDGPWLFLQKDDGKTDRVRGADLAARIAAASRRPTLIVLASCESGGGENAQGHGDQSGLARESFAVLLARAGVPAVLAMRGLISMSTIEKMMPVFFEQLLDHGRIDLALATARGRFREARDAWMPTLWMRLREGRIWTPEPPRRDLSKVKVPPILPYRCDRSPQEAKIRKAVRRHLKHPRRPLVMLVQGHFREAHDKFVERLCDDYLPIMLGDDGQALKIESFGPRELSDPLGGGVDERADVLWSEVAELLVADDEASPAEVAEHAADWRCPVLIDLFFNVRDDDPSPDIAVLRAWFERLAQWPAPDQGSEVVFVVRFSWASDEPRRSWWPFGARKNRAQEIEELFDDVSGRFVDRLDWAVLPTLDRVPEQDAASWIAEHARPWLVGALGDADEIEMTLRGRVEAFYADQESVCMDPLGRKLYQDLNELIDLRGEQT